MLSKILILKSQSVETRLTEIKFTALRFFNYHNDSKAINKKAVSYCKRHKSLQSLLHGLSVSQQMILISNKP